MPLKCFRDHEPVYAFDVETESAWGDLRHENANKKNLRLHCCNAGVTLRTSKLGTKHFAHARRGACSTAPETAEHLLAKRIVVEGIRRAGWTPTTEAPGDSPELGAWIADVMAEKGTAKVAFEVQWARQNDAETRYRQTRYQSTGVRGLWLFRQHDSLLRKACLLSSLVSMSKTRDFTCRCPRPLIIQP
jgi:competence CoiA-like predicted nuclease